MLAAPALDALSSSGGGLPPDAIRDHIRAALLASDHDHIPRAPEVALEVLRLSCDPDASDPELARLLQRDPALAGRLLQLVNTARYNRTGRLITSIREAVTRVGRRAVRDLLVSATVEQTLFRGPHWRLMHALWRQAVDTAVAAELIAQQTGQPAELVFSAVLLRDAGCPLLVHLIEDLTRGAAAEFSFQEGWLALSDELIVAASRQLFEAWALPEALQGALLGEGGRQAATLRLARWLATASSPSPRELVEAAEGIMITQAAATEILARYPEAREALC